MSAIFNLLISSISKWYIWLPIVIVLAYLAYHNNKRAKSITDTEHALLVLEIPRTNDKQELAAEQMFASLHGILRNQRELITQGGLQEHIGFEIASVNKRIRFYVWVPKPLQNFVEGQIYAQYPSVQISEAEEDYATRAHTQTVSYTAELQVIDNTLLPIKTFQSFEVDPLAAITGTLAKLDDPDEEMWIQVLARPIPDTWHRKATRYVNRAKNGGGGILRSGDPVTGISRATAKTFSALWQPPAESGGSKSEISEREKARISAVEQKSIKLGYQVKIRVAYLGNNVATAKLRMQAIAGTFKQFNTTNLNGFKQHGATFSAEGLAQYQARFFIDHGYILNIEELASVFHLPHTNVETPNIVWASSKTAEPPSILPVITGNESEDRNISAFGLTNFRGINQQFGLSRKDRGHHVYVIGQTGTGKTGMLELLALSDVFHNHGYAIIDPHGDFAVNNMRFIPLSRIKDVVYFNPADTTHPIGFNPMEVIDPAMSNNISSELIGVLKRMFGDSWGPRLEYILRYTILALLSYPESTMLDITRMLTDKVFRKKVLSYVTDRVVSDFWQLEFASWTDKFASEAISPVLNKVGAFTANPIIRNIVGQPKSTFDIRKIMDEGKILIVNLSKGLIGEDNASILGALLVIKIQLAAMSRSDIPRIEDRRPFYLYVDEFQNFATDSFAVILSEARKYGLNLVVANQYVSQMEDTVRNAVFGNVGTTVSFRVSADDAPLISKLFAPVFLPEDIMQLHSRHFAISMLIKGEKVPAFSGTTLTLPDSQTDYSAHIIQNSRQQFTKLPSEIEIPPKSKDHELEKLAQIKPETPAPLTATSNTPETTKSGTTESIAPGEPSNKRRRKRRKKRADPTKSAHEQVAQGSDNVINLR
ncbi:MAG TPA: type IV secretion system DNA-binding domain-containing protein [Patescibacteria group bacterium]|jgi:hypothetical protein|nr:type IV secretion system DNA-binding domain-containing protein [Patescibacteria group bacterium]